MTDNEGLYVTWNKLNAQAKYVTSLPSGNGATIRWDKGEEKLCNKVTVNGQIMTVEEFRKRRSHD